MSPRALYPWILGASPPAFILGITGAIVGAVYALVTAVTAVTGGGSSNTPVLKLLFAALAAAIGAAQSLALFGSVGSLLVLGMLVGLRGGPLPDGVYFAWLLIAMSVSAWSVRSLLGSRWR